MHRLVAKDGGEFPGEIAIGEYRNGTEIGAGGALLEHRGEGQDVCLCLELVLGERIVLGQCRRLSVTEPWSYFRSTGYPLTYIQSEAFAGI
jgi:hypothetical protein